MSKCARPNRQNTHTVFEDPENELQALPLLKHASRIKRNTRVRLPRFRSDAGESGHHTGKNFRREERF